MKIMQKLLKDEQDTFLIKTTAEINETNPVVDRIMDGDSVDTVIMANRDGMPILTNINLPVATRYSERLRRLGIMVQHMVMELDPFDEALVFRIQTLKEEVMVAPHKEFSIVVVQRDTKKTKREKPAHSERKKSDNSDAKLPAHP